MKKINVLQLGIAAILLLCAVSCQAQRQRDTVKVVMLICDTSRQYFWNTYTTFDTVINGIGRGRLISDTSYIEPKYSVYWQFGYSVREIYNEIEGVIDWYFDHQRPPQDYFVHKYYLDNKKRPLPKNIIVWMSVPK